MQTRQPDILNDKKERSDFFIALTIIALAGLFVTQTSLISAEESVTNNHTFNINSQDQQEDIYSSMTNEVEEEEVVVREVKEPSAVQGDRTYPTYKVTKRAPFDDLEMGKVEAASILSENIEPVNTVVSEIKEKAEDLTEETNETIEEVISDVLEDNEEAASEDPHANVELKKDIITIPENVDNASIETKKVLASAIDKKDLTMKNCVIAIGLYEETKNVSNLTSRLESEGYSVFTKDLSRLTQVGVYISCDPTISQSVLSEIKQIYAKDAFIVEQ